MKSASFILMLCLAAVVTPWVHWTEPVAPQDGGAPFPGWSAAPIPGDLSSLPLGPVEERFARQFPGKLAVFGEGNRTWIVRWVTVPTRKLHPASDCLRAAGYEVKATSASVDVNGDLWAGCTATRDHASLQVRERIFALTGPGWSDVSAWYWHALLGKSTGPWWAVTVMEPKGS